MLTILNLAGGAIIEQANDELQKIFENIMDINMQAGKKRELIIKVSFTPNDERDIVEPIIEVSSKLAGPEKVKTRLFIGTDTAGNIEVSENNSRQRELFSEEDGGNITPLERKKINDSPSHG